MSIETVRTPIINLLKVDKLSPSVVNELIEWEIDATGIDLEYAWYIYKGDERIAYIPYDKSNTLKWKPSEPGVYYIKGYVKNKNDVKVSEKSSEYIIYDLLMHDHIRNITTDKHSPQQIGTIIRWEADVIGENLEYAWYVYRGEERINYIPYNKNSYFDWTPLEAGIYQVKLFVIDMFGNKVSKWATDYMIQDSKGSFL